MTLLRTIISELKTDDKTEQIRQLCDRIKQEEEETILHPEALPQGPNIFLSLEVPGQTKNNISYLTLERESEDLYLAVLYNLSIAQYNKQNYSIRKIKVLAIEDHRPEKILTEYVKTYKHLIGE